MSATTTRAAAMAPTDKKLAKASTVMAAGSFLSRILGLFRTVLVVAVLGATTRQADILQLGTTIPTTIFYLVAGGALNTVLVPQIVRAVQNDEDEGEAYINRIITLTLVVLVATTALCALGAPLLLYVFADGKWRAAELAAHYSGLLFMSYLTMPQIFFFGVFFIVGQVLNAKDRFGPMMWAPIAQNVVLILNMLVYLMVWGTGGDRSAPFTHEQVLVLGIGNTLACVAQMAVMLPYMRSAGIRYRPRFDFKGTGLGHTAHVAKWVLLSVLVGQIGQVLNMRLASIATAQGAGAGITTIQNSILLWMLPHGMITVSLTTAMVPAISRLANADDLRGVGREFNRLLKLANTLIIPIALGMIVVATPLCMAIFGWRSGASGVPALAATLTAHLVGLPFYTVSYIQNRMLYALEDTKSTYTINNWQVVIGLVLAASGIFGIMAVHGDAVAMWVAPILAWAFAASNAIVVVMGFRILRQHLWLDLADIARQGVRVIVASVPAATAAWAVVKGITMLGTGPLVSLVALVPGAVVGVGLYFWLARQLHIQEASSMLSMLLRRKAPAVEPGATEHLGESAAPSPVPEAMEDAASTATGVAEPALATQISEQIEDTMDEATPAPVHVGDLIGNRYRLLRRIIQRGSVITWEAFDEVLARAVLLHTLPSGDERAHELLDAARRAAIATDPRYLRVLDAVHTPSDERLGSAVICECVPGVSVEGLLQGGTMTAVEAGWIAREVAQALAVMHDQGLYHERINPDTVIVSTSGGVKIVGFLTEAVLVPNDDPYTEDEAELERRDVQALGRLLFAMLVARWPGRERYGLPAAPEGMTPRQVMAGVSPSLDQIVDRILSPHPRSGLEPLLTAHDIDRELTRTLGSTDGSHELERLVRSPETTMVMASFRPESGAAPMTPASATSAASAASAVSAASAMSATEPPSVSEFVESDGIELVEAPMRTYSWHLDDMFADEREGAVSPGTPRRASQITPDSSWRPKPVPAVMAGGRLGTGSAIARPPRTKAETFTWVLVGLISLATVVCLVVGLLFVLPGAGKKEAQPRAATTPSVSTSVAPPAATAPTAAPSGNPTLKPLALRTARDYDPLGSGRENAPLVRRAIDQSTTSAWLTEPYGTATFDGKKPGVGYYVDLGKQVEVGEVSVTWTKPGVSYEIRVPAGRALPRELDGWTSVGQGKSDAAADTVTLPTGTRTRYVLVWITQLPEGDNGKYQAGLADIEVRG